jgi:hypothetical protein
MGFEALNSPFGRLPGNSLFDNEIGRFTHKLLKQPAPSEGEDIEARESLYLHSAALDPVIIKLAHNVMADSFDAPTHSVPVSAFAELSRTRLQELGIPAENAEAVFILSLTETARIEREAAQARLEKVTG